MTTIAITEGLSSAINAKNINDYGQKTNGKYNDPAKWAASNHRVQEINNMKKGLKLSTTIR